ncbi:MAG: hypothetical protein QF552_06145 [Litorilituus sp.]|nr:hypothetical protein [Litorilituus sp.]
MKEQVGHISKVIVFITIIMLQACGSDNETNFSVSANTSKVSFSNEFSQASSETIAIQVNFTGDGLLVGYAPEVTPVAWLKYRSENVTANSATIYLDVINGEFLLADTYLTKIRLAVSNDDASNFAYHDIDVSLLIWNLAVDTQKIKYNGTFGDDSIVEQTFTITSEKNAWTASVDVDWLSLDVTSGTGDATIVVTPDIGSLAAPGLQQGNIILTESTSGDSKSIPVELALDNVYLYAERSAVSLMSTAAKSALATTVAINNNGKAISWQASTEADWLTVSSVGDNKLHITADPNIAPLHQNSSAQVLVTADLSSHAISEIIHVNFYNSDLMVENKVLSPLEINDNEMLTSPLKPQFYVAVANKFITYHQYTGEPLSSLTVSPENSDLEQLILHPEGDYILAKAIETVMEGDVSTTVIHRYKIDPTDNTFIEIVDFDIAYEPTNIVHLSGRYFVVTQTLEFADENLKVLFWDPENAYFATKIDLAAQANTLFALDNNSVSIKRYLPQVNDFGDDKVMTTLTHEYHPESLPDGEPIYDFIVSNDEAHIYAVSSTSEWISFDGEAFTDNGLLEINENVVTLLLAKNNDSQPNYLRINTSSPLGFYLDIYDNEQNLTSTVLTQGSQPSSLKLSGDDQRLIINVDRSNNLDVDSQIELISL